MCGKDLREIIVTSCCTFYNTGITRNDLTPLSRVSNIAYARYGWRLNIIRDELDTPTWRVYLADTKLTGAEIAQLKCKTGPVTVLEEILNELAETIR